MTQIVAVQDALVTLVKLIEDPNNVGEFADASKLQSDCGFAEADLPFFWIRRGRLIQRRQESSNTFLDTRAFQANLYVGLLCGDEHADEPVFEAAANWVVPVLNYLSCVRSIGAAELVDIRDTGDISLYAKNGNRYSGASFALQLRTRESV